MAQINTSEHNYARLLKWLMLLRVVFITVLMGLLLLLQLKEIYVAFNRTILYMYGIIGGLYALTVLYAIVFRHIRRLKLFAAIQLNLDVVLVSLIVFMTGGYSSTFTFLYLVVIIYTSMLLGTRQCVLIAAFAGIQYGALVNLEYYALIRPPSMTGNPAAYAFEWTQVLFKIMSTLTACFVVAWLSSLLSIQLRRSRLELATVQAHLKRAEKMAAVGSLAAGLAHEIRNPLASLSGSIQILQEDLTTNPDHQRLMRIVLRETERLNALLNDFLKFAKPSESYRQYVDASQVLKEVTALFQKGLLENGRITLTTQLAPGSLILADPLHLHQIIWNLLLNAAESIAQRGEIHLEMQTTPEATLHVTITDTGCGIAPETLNHVFDPFFSTKAHGSGLGLAIVHSLVELNEGRIHIESTPGRGTHVRISFKHIRK